MKTSFSQHGPRAMTFLDVAIALATVALLAAVLLPALARTRSTRSPRIHCVSNLKQVGLAFRMWANDHNNLMPMQVSTNQGGSMEFIPTGEVWRHFESLSNELSTPRILKCVSDPGRTRVNSFAEFGPTNLSYFVGLDADETKMQMLLSGDRNITNGLPPNNHILQATGPDTFGWTKAIHNNAGNIGLADGSAAQTTTTTLRRQLTDPSNATNRLALP